LRTRVDDEIGLPVQADAGIGDVVRAHRDIRSISDIAGLLSIRLWRQVL
jgi:hypothetical protein